MLCVLWGARFRIRLRTYTYGAPYGKRACTKFDPCAYISNIDILEFVSYYYILSICSTIESATNSNANAFNVSVAIANTPWQRMGKVAGVRHIYGASTRDTVPAEQMDAAHTIWRICVCGGRPRYRYIQVQPLRRCCLSFGQGSPT